MIILRSLGKTLLVRPNIKSQQKVANPGECYAMQFMKQLLITGLLRPDLKDLSYYLEPGPAARMFFHVFFQSAFSELRISDHRVLRHWVKRISAKPSDRNTLDNHVP